MPWRITTTLYDLITAIHSVTERDEDELVVPLVTHWMCTGRLTLLRAVHELPAWCTEEDMTTPGEVWPTTCMGG